MTRGSGFDDQVRKLPRYQLSEETKARHLRMLAELASTDKQHTSFRRHPQWARRRRALAIVGIVVVTGGASVGTAAALGLFSAKPTDRKFATCYATDDVNGKDNHLDITVATGGDGNASEKDAANSAMDICTGAWQQGRLSATDVKVHEDPQSPPWNRKVPPLIACVLPSGQVGIFPGTSQTCRDLGLLIAEL